MALDMSMFSGFSMVFMFLFIYAFIYGFLEFGKLFGKENPMGRGLNALVALGISVFVLMSPKIMAFIRFSIPWFVVMMIIVFFIIFTTKMFTGDTNYGDVIFKGPRGKQFVTFIIIFVIIIFIFGLGKALGPDTLNSGGWAGTTQVSGQGAGNLDNGGYDTAIPLDENGDYTGTVDEFISETGVGNTQVDGSQVATTDYSTNVLHTIVNPKVLGFILVMLIAVFAMFFISE